MLDVRGQLGEDAPVVVALAGMNEDGKPMVAVATNEAARKQGIKLVIWSVALPRFFGGGGGASRTSHGWRRGRHQDRRGT